MMKKRGLFLLAAVFCISLCACGGNEKAVKPTNAPTPTEVVEPTTTPTVTFEPTSTPVPTETVEPTTTPTPTETPVANEDREVVDYYIDPHTGQKVAVTATPTPEPTPVITEKVTLYGEITDVRRDSYNDNLITIRINIACPHEDCYWSDSGINYYMFVEDTEANAQLYVQGDVVAVTLDEFPPRCGGFDLNILPEMVKAGKDYYIDPNTGEKVEREPVVEETTPTPQVEERIYYGEVTDYEENGTVILVHVECTHEGNFIGLCWGGGQGSIVRFRFENAEDVAKQYPIGTVVKMVSTGEPLMCPLPCWGELSGITIVTE